MPNPMNPIGSFEATADTTTYITSGIAFPGAQPNNQYAKQFIINNEGAVSLRFKKGPATGPDASNTTDTYPRITVPAGQSHTYSRGNSETHLYAYAASSCAFSVTVGSGP